MADSNQSKNLRPKGPLLPMKPSKTATTSTFRTQDGPAVNLIMTKDNEKRKSASLHHIMFRPLSLHLGAIRAKRLAAVLFNPRDTPQPFLEPDILEKRRGEQGWKPQDIGGRS